MPEYYDSIENCPIYSYWKVLQTKNKAHLLKCDSNRDIPNDLQHSILAAWDKIESEIIDLRLKDSSFQLKMNEELRFLRKKLKAVLSDSAYDKTVYNQELKKRQKENENDSGTYDVWKICAAMSRYMKFRVDPREFTVVEFFTILNEMKDGRKEN